MLICSTSFVAGDLKCYRCGGIGHEIYMYVLNLPIAQMEQKMFSSFITIILIKKKIQKFSLTQK